MISESAVSMASPGAVVTTPSATVVVAVVVTSVSSSTLTVNDPWVTTAGVTRTLPPMTMVPVRELTITLAAGRAGSTSTFSSRLKKATRWDGSIGARILMDALSSATATSSPKISLTASATLLAVLKSPLCRLRIIFSAFKNGVSTMRSTTAPPGIRPTVGMLTITDEPSFPVTPRPPTTRLPCAIA